MGDATMSHHQKEFLLLVPPAVEKVLPSMVRAELGKLTPAQQGSFLEEFKRKSKGLGAAYLCSLLYCHYGYLGRWGMTVIMWIAALTTFGVVGILWWLVDLFRIPGLVQNYNRDTAIEVLRNFKAISG